MTPCRKARKRRIGTTPRFVPRLCLIIRADRIADISDRTVSLGCAGALAAAGEAPAGECFIFRIVEGTGERADGAKANRHAAAGADGGVGGVVADDSGGGAAGHTQALG